jgi:hypothetical protein
MILTAERQLTAHHPQGAQAALTAAVLDRIAVITAIAAPDTDNYVPAVPLAGRDAPPLLGREKR